MELQRALGVEPRRLSPEEIANIVRENSATFDEIIKTANIKADLAVHRIVGRIEIKDDLVRRSLVRLRNKSTSSLLMAAGLWLIL